MGRSGCRGGGGGGRCKVLNIRRREGVTKIGQVRTMEEGGSKVWSFCENVILECPLWHCRKKLFLVY